LKNGNHKPVGVAGMTGATRSFALLLIVVFCGVIARAGEGVASPASEPAPAIVIGFVGGFVHPDDARHAEVQLARKLAATYGNRVHSEVFDNHHRKDAYRAVRHWLDIDQDGDLSDTERRASRIVIFGHSWGAAAALDLARDLQRENIPVLLTVQVDSINKLGQNDRVVPPNVAKAVNFYQTRGLLHGRTEITAADPAHTEILGQFRFDYAKMPEECFEYPWLKRHLFKGHTAIECDPDVWSQIGNLIDAALFGNKTQPSLSEATLR
jgi:pimeloyl-ACP methyl ester carboxylesterase